MIDEIHVRNLALIRDAEIVPATGMTAITGETGAGKTALLASCKLLMGQRADRGLVREGADEAEVQGRLFLREDISLDGGVVVEADDAFQPSLIPAEREVVVGRKLTADGRSHVKINGEMASVAELSQLVAPAIDLCSQHDHQALTKPQEQRRFLDLWCENDVNGCLVAYRDAFEAVRTAREELARIEQSKSVSDARVEDARYVLRQIDAVGPTQEDYDELMGALRKSESAELLGRVSSEAHAALADEGGALDSLNEALALLEEGSHRDEALGVQVDALREALFVAEDVAREVAAYQSAIDLDVAELERMQERAAAYQSLMRTYGPGIADVLERAADARRTLEMVEGADEVEQEARRALEDAETKLKDAGDALGRSRAEGAPRFSDAVSDVMARLEMGSARIVCQVEQLPFEQWGDAGPDEVQFMFCPAPGMQLRPMARIASGGELSRVMLALHVVMGERDATPTLVFDEIDAGVGGATALALGDVLVELAHTHQVIVVTHLAQVAAKAARHYVVSKTTDGAPPRTLIERVDGTSRIEEIARMLSGSITEASLQHAEELLGQTARS